MHSNPTLTAEDPLGTQSIAEHGGFVENTLGDDVASLIQSTGGYRGPDRRASRRIPRTLEITVQPLDVQLNEWARPFFAITRDVSQGGLAYLSSQKADFEKAVVSLNDGIAPGIVCRICNTSLVHSLGKEEVWLTNVQFLHVYQRRK
ncbi:hypothetical protein Mal15_05240 [Stieleria maiorica]|uniref:PilZ domain-containing protein n=1 Tax=Stieleria maiorica TaxID=2795974 RepID=A0A5B9M8I9_9BACT|nr:PilZ domain-containing protein [Stieleria maiorica]QEF96496.1 hypothetical protein Mal15_05240 [Stieleria maiorica]